MLRLKKFYSFFKKISLHSLKHVWWNHNNHSFFKKFFVANWNRSKPYFPDSRHFGIYFFKKLSYIFNKYDKFFNFFLHKKSLILLFKKSFFFKIYLILLFTLDKRIFFKKKLNRFLKFFKIFNKKITLFFRKFLIYFFFFFEKTPIFIKIFFIIPFIYFFYLIWRLPFIFLKILKKFKYFFKKIFFYYSFFLRPSSYKHVNLVLFLNRFHIERFYETYDFSKKYFYLFFLSTFVTTLIIFNIFINSIFWFLCLPICSLFFFIKLVDSLSTNLFFIKFFFRPFIFFFKFIKKNRIIFFFNFKNFLKNGGHYPFSKKKFILKQILIKRPIKIIFPWKFFKNKNNFLAFYSRYSYEFLFGIYNKKYFWYDTRMPFLPNHWVMQYVDFWKAINPCLLDITWEYVFSNLYLHKINFDSDVLDEIIHFRYLNYGWWQHKNTLYFILNGQIFLMNVRKIWIPFYFYRPTWMKTIKSPPHTITLFNTSLDSNYYRDVHYFNNNGLLKIRWALKFSEKSSILKRRFFYYTDGVYLRKYLNKTNSKFTYFFYLSYIIYIQEYLMWPWTYKVFGLKHWDSSYSGGRYSTLKFFFKIHVMVNTNRDVYPRYFISFVKNDDVFVDRIRNRKHLFKPLRPMRFYLHHPRITWVARIYRNEVYMSSNKGRDYITTKFFKIRSRIKYAKPHMSRNQHWFFYINGDFDRLSFFNSLDVPYDLDFIYFFI